MGHKSWVLREAERDQNGVGGKPYPPIPGRPEMIEVTCERNQLPSVFQSNLKEYQQKVTGSFHM